MRQLLFGGVRSFRFRLAVATHLLPVGAVAIAVALLPHAAFAQEGAEGATDDRSVMLWTTVVVVLSLLAATVGYAYRRIHGMDHPTPDELEMMGGGHGHDDEAVHPHAEAEHGVPGAVEPDAGAAPTTSATSTAAPAHH